MKDTEKTFKLVREGRRESPERPLWRRSSKTSEEYVFCTAEGIFQLRKSNSHGLPAPDEIWKPPRLKRAGKRRSSRILAFKAQEGWSSRKWSRPYSKGQIVSR